MKQAKFYLGMFILFTLLSCKKYLDKKPEDTLRPPSSIADIQALLDNTSSFNFGHAAEMLCDDYYMLDPDWAALQNQDMTQKNLYIWERDNNTSAYWDGAYKNILILNIALEELPKMPYTPDQYEAYNNVKGSALFLRSFYFYHIAQLFAKPYIKSTASNDLGIVLRLNTDINEHSVRASVKLTYDQILNDFKLSASLLPVKPLVKTRPSRPAAYGALARTYLSMQQYDSARKYADLCLEQYDSLIDYNELAASNLTPSKYNKEVIFSARTSAITTYIGTKSKIDSNLYKSYASTDLRRRIFFRPASGGGVQFKGDYEGIGMSGNTFFSFIGIVTDEIYLINAECNARGNNLAAALETLNKLLKNRYESGTFIPVTASTRSEVLAIILNERRKELLRRGVRWTDLRRLAHDQEFKVNPERVIGNQRYSMIKNDLPYILLIPALVISLTGMQQN